MKKWLKIPLIGIVIFAIFYFTGIGGFLSFYFGIGTLDNLNPWPVSVGMGILFVVTFTLYSFFRKKEIVEKPKVAEVTTPAQKIAEIILWIFGIISLVMMIWIFRSFAA